MRIISFILLWLTFGFTYLFGQADSLETVIEPKIVENIELEASGPSVVARDEIFHVLVRAKGDKGQAFEGLRIECKIRASKSFVMDSYVAETDSLGKAYFTLKELDAGGDYKLIFFSSETNYHVAGDLHEVHVREANWLFVMIIGLLGGLSLFLFGMSMMSKGMQNSAGDQMRNILNRLTNNRFVAVGVGALITTVIQSSSATNVMLVSFVDSRLLRFRQTIGIILGAAIGTTITAQIIAFKITDYALIFVSIGLIVHFVSRKNQYIEIGRAILGFGILFFGMHIMSESMYPMRSYQPFIDILIQLEKPILGIIVGALFTALIQSSSAFIGILIVLAMQGLLSIEASVSLIIGANIGTAITALLASINTNREARQVAVAHTIIKVVGATIFVFFIPLFIRSVEFLSHQADAIASPREIANAHTIYNIVLTLLFLPFTRSIARFVNFIYPIREDEPKPLQVKYIDTSLLEAPSIALKAAREELLRMMNNVHAMTSLIIEPYFDKKSIFEGRIDTLEEKVNFLRDEITGFLVELTRNDISKNNVKEAFVLMHAVKEFEEIADVISSQLKTKAISWCNHDYDFSEAGKREISSFHSFTLKIIQKSIQVYQNLDIKKAQKLKDRYNGYREEYYELERSHYERLKANVEETVSSSKTHLELITLLKVICSHATNTSRIIIAEQLKVKKKKK